MSVKFIRQCILATATLLVFYVYVSTLCPTIGAGGNHGEFTASVWLLGNSHPTGYPLYHLLGRLLLFLPLGSIAARLNLLSAITVSLASLFTGLALKQFSSATPCWIIAVAYPAFTPLLWRQALTAEVYGLNLMAWALLLYVVVHRAMAPAAKVPLLVFVAGLSLGNHGLIIFLLVPLFLTVVQRWRRYLPTAALFFFLAGGIYLYLPIRGDRVSTINWGTPNNADRLVKTMTGRQFQGQLGRLYPGQLQFRIAQSLANTRQNLSLFSFTFSVVGLIAVLFRARLLGFLGLVSGLGVLGFTWIYGIYDIQEYLSPVYLLLGLYSGFGLAVTAKLLFSNRVRYRAFMLTMCLVGVGYPLVQNYSRCSLHTSFTAKEFGTILLQAVPMNGNLIFKGDNSSNALAYLQVVERYRTDVKAWDANGYILNNPCGRPITNKQALYSGLYRVFTTAQLPVLSTFKDDLEAVFQIPFRSSGLLYYPEFPRLLDYFAAVQSAPRLNYRKMRTSPYVTPAEAELLAEFHILIADSYAQQGSPEQAITELQLALQYGNELAHIYAVAAARLKNLNQSEAALTALETALDLNPFAPDTLNNYAWTLLILSKNFEQALAAVDRAVTMEPANPSFRHTRGLVYLATGKNEQAIADLRIAVKLAPASQVYQSALRTALAAPALGTP